MIEQEHIILFSSDDWSSGLKTSKYHVAIRLARKNKVLFVNSIGLRSPNLSSGKDWGRIWQKLKGFLKGAEKIQENLYVYTPIAIPFGRFAFVRLLNQWILTFCLRWQQKALKLNHPILLIFSQNMVSLIGQLKEKQVVYYCIDELTGYRETDRKTLLQLEKELLDKSDCVIACSKKLADMKKVVNANTYYVPHGVDWELFRSSITKEFSCPADIQHFKKPIIGYYGFISDDWIDYELINKISSIHPDWSIVLIGRTKENISKRMNGQNIHFLGIKKFEELPAYNQYFDAAIIPFVLNELTESSNPLKLYEYLSSGLPVVSVKIPEIIHMNELVEIGENHDDFIAKLEKVIRENKQGLKEQRSLAMNTEDWNQRIETISDIIIQHRRERP